MSHQEQKVPGDWCGRGVQRVKAGSTTYCLKLHETLETHADPWTRHFAGCVLIATYSRCRWSDIQHIYIYMIYVCMYIYIYIYISRLCIYIYIHIVYYDYIC